MVKPLSQQIIIYEVKVCEGEAILTPEQSFQYAKFHQDKQFQGQNK